MTNTEKVITHKVPADLLAAAMDRGLRISTVIRLARLLGKHEATVTYQTKAEARRVIAEGNQ